MSEIQDKQFLFSKLLGEFLVWLNEQGYDVVVGEVLRTKEQAKLNAKKGVGIANSLHIKCLAVDIELFIDGTWLRGDTDPDDFEALADKWESMHHLCRAGFRFGDPYHFSETHAGVQ